METKHTYTYEIFHDEKLVETLENQPHDVKLFGLLLRLQSNSVYHAFKYEGWRVDVINEQTGERLPWKY